MLVGAGRRTEESSGSSCAFLSTPRSTQPVPLCPVRDHPRDRLYALGALERKKNLYVAFEVNSNIDNYILPENMCGRDVAQLLKLVCDDYGMPCSL